MWQGLYAQVIMISQKDLDNKKEKEKTNNTTFKGIPQDQYAVLILIRRGYKKILVHIHWISMKNLSKKY